MSPNRLSLLLLLILCLLLSPARSSLIRLPSDDDDLCDVSQSSGATCPVRCFRPDPVCGADGVTYWCGCSEAVCAGTRVSKLGFCHVGNGGSGGQAFLLVHIVWLLLLGFSLCFGLL